jgi:hypothetical protein
MLDTIYALVRKHIVDEVPDAMSACLDCGTLDCRDNIYETCPNRLRAEAALRTARSIWAQPSGRD